MSDIFRDKTSVSAFASAFGAAKERAVDDFDRFAALENTFGSVMEEIQAAPPRKQGHTRG